MYNNTIIAGFYTQIYMRLINAKVYTFKYLKNYKVTKLASLISTFDGNLTTGQIS